MSKKVLKLLLFGFVLGGLIAVYVHYQNPKPIQREDGSWQMPFNPFAKAKTGDWQCCPTTLRIEDESDTTVLNWKISLVEGEKVFRALEANGEDGAAGTYSNAVTPSIEEFLGGLAPNEIEEVKFERTSLDVKGKSFACIKVSFIVHDEDGNWLKVEKWMSKEVKGTGLAHATFNFMDFLKVDMDLAGYGNGDKADWGDKLDTIRQTAVHGPRFGEAMRLLRGLAMHTRLGRLGQHRAEHTADELVIDLKDGTTTDELLAFGKRHKIELRWESYEPSALRAALAIAHVAADREDALKKELASDPLVESVEHNDFFSIPDQGGDVSFSEFALGKRTIPEEEADKPREGFPNDTLFDKQWHLRMIHAPEAWKTATGKGVIVGVIDTGVAYEKKKGMQLPDLAGTKFVEGYDFVNDDRIASDDHGHGSHCSGTIAQTTDNGRGCAGVAPGATIMPLKVLDRNGSGTAADVAAAIRYAADHGCKVMNLSLGGSGRSQVMANAVKYAFDKGCVVCCAAGNSGRGRVEYPAAYDGALAVSSVGPSGQRAFYSSYGDQVWVAGPGGDQSQKDEDGVLQNTIDPSGKGKSYYAWWQGTSMATPHVAGVAALVIERGVTNPKAVRDILAATAQKGGKTGQGWDKELGYGIVDAEAAVKAAGAPDRTAIVIVAGLVIVALLVMRGRRDELSSGVLVLGSAVGACGLGFFGLLPSLSFMHAFPEWGQGSPLFASAAIPFFVGLVCVPSKAARSFAVGLMLGSAAHMSSMAWYGYSDIAWIPFHLDRAWLAANAAVLVIGSGMVVRLAKGKGVA